MKILILNLVIAAIVMASNHAGQRRLAERISTWCKHSPIRRPNKKSQFGPLA
jgi:hypothetical protein